MTIFDVLRYPIGNPPTAEELEAIPNDLFDKWWNSCIICKENYRRDKLFAIKYFSSDLYLASDRLDLDRLRKMLGEYDEPI